MTIRVFAEAGAFGGDKDAAARLREKQLKPALAQDQQSVVHLDFAGVDFATQSFIHAVLSSVVRRNPKVLDRIQFDNCTDSVREIIEIVVQYSQEDLAPSPAGDGQT